jgi:hypothetical protein
VKNHLNIKLVVLLCCTLGLAPFLPEPHIWGKLKWIAGGGNGMKLMDYGDTLLHGFPWVLLIYFAANKIGRRNCRTIRINRKTE